MYSCKNFSLEKKLYTQKIELFETYVGKKIVVTNQIFVGGQHFWIENWSRIFG